MNEGYKNKLQYLEHPILGLEIMDFLLGDLIGSGCHRDTYQWNFDKKWVIKVERGEGCGDNWAEWRIWGAVEGTEHAKWFAECKWISENGTVMMQRRTNPLEIKKESEIPDKIPNFLADVHTGNFGWIGKQLTCHDYSYSLERFMNNGGLNKKMQTTKGKLK